MTQSRIQLSQTKGEKLSKSKQKNYQRVTVMSVCKTLKTVRLQCKSKDKNRRGGNLHYIWLFYHDCHCGFFPVDVNYNSTEENKYGGLL